MAKYSFICSVCQNYNTNKCEGCNGQGAKWEPINKELYDKDPHEYMRNLISAYFGIGATDYKLGD